MRRDGWMALALLAVGACDGSTAIQRPTTNTSEGAIGLSGGQTVGGPARELTNDDGPRFSGLALVRFIGGCSGAFVVPPGVDLLSDGPAFLLTAGHCLALAPPNSVGANIANPGLTPVQFRHFRDAPDAAIEVPIASIGFVTMKGVDLALVELALS